MAEYVYVTWVTGDPVVVAVKAVIPSASVYEVVPPDTFDEIWSPFGLVSEAEEEDGAVFVKGTVNLIPCGLVTDDALVLMIKPELSVATPMA